MTLEELRWLVGISVSTVIAIATIAVTAFRSMSTKLDEAMSSMRTTVKEGDDQLHERVNRLRQDMSDGYVRRVDLDSHMKRLDDTLKELRDDQKHIMKSLAKLEATQPPSYGGR